MCYGRFTGSLCKFNIFFIVVTCYESISFYPRYDTVLLFTSIPNRTTQWDIVFAREKRKEKKEAKHHNTS